MATIYKKNARNVYVVPLYARFWTWWFVILVLALLVHLFVNLIKIKLILAISSMLWALLAILMIYKMLDIVVQMVDAKGVSKFLAKRYGEKSVTSSLLATMSVNRLQETPYISVPSVTVVDDRPSRLVVKVEKLAGMYDLDRMIEDINASFRGKLGGYAVTSAMITSDGLTYQFILEDVMVDKTWKATPSDFDNDNIEPYHLKLQEGLLIRLDERPHIAVWGKTGSKKTTVLLSLILQLFSMGADVRFIDGKDEFSSFKGFYPEQKIVSNPDDVFNQLEEILGIIEERQKIIAREVQKRGKMGLKASDIGLRPVVLVADEIGSIVALMDSKQSKRFVADLVAIIQRARSVGVSLKISTQSPDVDTIPQKIRAQYTTKILLGSANSDIQRMAFGEVATSGDVEDFRGFYVCDGLTNQPMKFFVPDLYTHGMNELAKFEEAFRRGLDVEYREG